MQHNLIENRIGASMSLLKGRAIVIGGTPLSGDYKYMNYIEVPSLQVGQISIE
jgi:hypothetical protein